MEERLIEAIKMQPCLFDKGSNLFRNKYLKDRVWQAVAASVGVSEEHCRSRWKSLRDRFVREVAANRPKSGDAANEKQKWCFLDAMRFLTKHIAPKKTISNLVFEDDEPSCSNSPQTPVCESGGMMGEIVEVVEEELNKSTGTPAGRKRKRVEESQERFDRLCGSIEAVIASKAQCTDSENSAFLQMLDECLKKKPEHVRERLKIEILTHAYNTN